MNEFQENTSFVLSKMDSLLTQAMPHLEKGAEELVKYHSLTMVFSYIGLLVLDLVLVIFAVVITKKVSENEWDEFVWPPFILIALFPLAFTLFAFHTFIQALVAPEIYTIMQIIK